MGTATAPISRRRKAEPTDENELLMTFSYSVDGEKYDRCNSQITGTCESYCGEFDDIAVGQEPAKIGTITMRHIRMGMALTAGLHSYDVFDCHSSTLQFYSVAYRHEGDGSFALKPRYTDDTTAWTGCDILIIETLKVHEQFHGRGIGSFMLTEALSVFGKSSLVMLEAVPLPFDTNRPKDQLALLRRRLYRFYRRFGFQRVGRSSYWWKYNEE